MTAVTLEKSDLALQSIRIDKSCIRIGRRSGNDYVLDDPSVSGYHAEIRLTDSGCYIKDLNSTNGTFVNDALVYFLKILPTDTIRLGNSLVRLEFPPSFQDSEEKKTLFYPEPEPSTDHIKPMSGHDWLSSLSLLLHDPEDVVDEGVRALADPHPLAPDSVMKKEESSSAILDLGSDDEWQEEGHHWALLIVQSHSSENKEILLDKPCTKIGSGARCVVSITYDPTGYWLVYLRGTETPLLNGASCQKGESYRLLDGDQIIVASSSITFSWPN